MAPFDGWGSAASKLQSYFEGAVHFLPISSQKFLVVILSNSEGWKAKSTSGFEPEIPGLRVQRLL